MKMIVGLGNPEPEYSNTRHNIGKNVLNLYVDEISEWKEGEGFNAVIFKDVDCLYVKPLSYMNDCGPVISKIFNYYKIKSKELLVIYDELDIFMGEYKIALGKGSKIHNGILSINENLGFSNYWHLRMGVRDLDIPSSVQKSGIDPAKYVLRKFQVSDRKKIENLVQTSVIPEIRDWLSKK